MPKTLLGELEHDLQIIRPEDSEFVRRQLLPTKYAESRTKDWCHIFAILPAIKYFTPEEYRRVLEATRQMYQPGAITNKDANIGFLFLLQAAIPYPTLLTEEILVNLLTFFGNEIHRENFDEYTGTTVALLLTLYLKLPLSVSPSDFPALKANFTNSEIPKHSVLYDYLAFCLDSLERQNRDSLFSRYLMPVFDRLGYIGAGVAITLTVLGILAAVTTPPGAAVLATAIMVAVVAVLPTRSFSEIFEDMKATLSAIKNTRQQRGIIYYRFAELFYGTPDPILTWFALIKELPFIFQVHARVEKPIAIMLLAFWRIQIIEVKKGNMSRLAMPTAADEQRIYDFIEERLTATKHDLSRTRTKVWFQILAGMKIVENRTQGFWDRNYQKYIIARKNQKDFEQLYQLFDRELMPFSNRAIHPVPTNLYGLLPKNLLSIELVQREWFGDKDNAAAAKLRFKSDTAPIAIHPYFTINNSVDTLLRQIQSIGAYDPRIMRLGVTIINDSTIPAAHKEFLLDQLPKPLVNIMRVMAKDRDNYFMMSVRQWDKRKLYTQYSNFGVFSTCYTETPPGPVGHYKFQLVPDSNSFYLINRVEGESRKLFSAWGYPHEILSTRLYYNHETNRRFILHPRTVAGPDDLHYFLLSTESNPTYFVNVGRDLEGRCRSWSSSDEAEQAQAAHFILHIV
ncbi:MAG: hypothetical protein K2Q14_01190 [Gammaproteobacteria bacterium]|nr:hypothetical protein [Gammaproteobacteria bacterium]